MGKAQLAQNRPSPFCLSRRRRTAGRKKVVSREEMLLKPKNENLLENLLLRPKFSLVRVN